jgi:hypothetical protein
MHVTCLSRFYDLTMRAFGTRIRNFLRARYSLPYAQTLSIIRTGVNTTLVSNFTAPQYTCPLLISFTCIFILS